MEEKRIGYFFDGPLIPSTEGASYRVLNICKYLSHSFPVFIIKCWREVDDYKKFKKLTSKFRNLKVLLINPEIYYKQPKRLLNIIRKEKINVLISKDPEIILSSFLFFRERIQDLKIVFDAHYTEDELLQQMGFSKREVEMKKIQELAAHYYSDVHFSVSKKDLQHFLEIGCKKNKIKIVENGVDCCEINFYGPNFEAKTVLFLGNMHYFPNLDAAKLIIRKIAPLVKGPVKFLFIGAFPRELLRYKSDNIIFTGPVEDLNPFLKNVTLAISPIRYLTGASTKILCYLAAGLPVIATEKAVRGLEGVEGVLVENRIEKYPDTILTLLSDEAQLKKMSREGRKTVEKYDWRLITRKVKKYIEEV